MRGVPVKNASEALYVAREMEKRAIRLYERALSLWPQGEAAAAIDDMLRDEKRHLRRFEEMAGGADDIAGAEALLLSAHAAGVLFEGGLTAAARTGAFDSPRALYAFAAEQEKIAVDCYTLFAQSCPAEAKQAFIDIAREESGHLSALEAAQIV